MKKYMIIAAACIFSISLLFTAQLRADTITVMPFTVSGIEGDEYLNFGKLLVLKGKEQFGISDIRMGTASPDAGAFDPGNSGHIRAASSAGRSAGADYVIAGSVEKAYMGIQVKAALISTSRSEAVFRTSYYSPKDNMHEKSASEIMGRIALHMKGTVIHAVGNISAATDNTKGKIRITWDRPEGTKAFAVYRSPFSEGPFEEIGRVDDGAQYEDATAQRGIGYWYTVAPVIENVGTGPAGTVETHLKAPMPEGLNIEAVKRAKRVSDRRLRRQKAKRAVRRHLAFLDEYYMHPVKLTLVFLVAKSYLQNGTLIALRGFSRYTLDFERREVFMERDDNAFCVILNANKFFRLIAAAKKKNLPRQKELIDRLVHNGVAYVMYSGEKKVADSMNHTIYVPCFEAFGMSTEYFKNYRGWKQNTVMFGTSNSELKKKMKKARRGHRN